jgi:hypothetical protein
VSYFVAACIGHNQALGFAANANIDEAVQAFVEDHTARATAAGTGNGSWNGPRP